MRVLRHSAKLPEVEDPKTWLARIAWRVAIDRSRQRSRRSEVSIEDDAGQEAVELVSSDPAADATVQGMRLDAALEKMIAALPTKLREPLILSTVEEMSPREVAATLKINEAAVRSRVFRARQILKQKLQQSGQG
jgi:RNA polymerase sigma-70 factor (ECF subfamily)